MVYLDMSCFAKSKIGSFCEYGMYLDGFGQAEGLFPEPVFSSSETTLDGCGTMYVYGFCLWLVGKEWVWGGASMQMKSFLSMVVKDWEVPFGGYREMWRVSFFELNVYRF